jgi:hypothetical protein
MRRTSTGRHALAPIVATVAFGVALTACGGDDDTDPESSATQAELQAETARADEAEAQLAEIEATFPVTVDASLDGYDVVGGYTMSLTEAWCDGLPDCGVQRPDVHADIIQGANGLELQIPNVLTAGLFSVSGSLYAVTDSDLIAQPCGSTPRNSRVSVTIFGDGVTIASDGTSSLSGLGGSLLVEANEVADCGEGVIFFAADLTPD